MVGERPEIGVGVPFVTERECACEDSTEAG